MAINFLTTTNTLPEIQINDTGNNPRLELQESGIVSGGISTTGGALVFEASSGIERARITSVGLFGIGKIPSQWILDVDSANAYIGSFDGSGNTGVVLNSNNSTAAQIIGYSNSVSAYNDLDIRSNSTAGSGVYIDGSTSRVGVGTTTPHQQLHIRGSAPWIRIEENSASNKRLDIYVDPSTAIGTIAANQSAQQLSFQTASTDRLRITNAGNVGIATSNPVEKLQINSGDVLINNSTISTLKSGGSLYIDLNTFGSYSGRNFRISDNGTSLVNVKQTGEFGIGTTSPAYKLDVNGDNARIGGSTQTTTYLRVEATNTAGSPARAVGVLLKGYEGRGIGTYYEDTTYSGEEWYNGMPYSGGFNYYQIGYDASGGQPEYAANSMLRIYHTGKTILSTYGSGTHTGTAAKYLAVTSSGEIIETGSGGVLPGGPYLPLTGGTLTGSGNVPLYVTSSGSVSYIQIQNSSTGTSGTSDGLTIGNNGTAAYIWNREQANLLLGTNDTTAVTIDSSQNATFAGNVVLGTGDNLYLNGTTGLRILHDGSNALFINQTAGDVKIQNSVSDKDIIFRGNDGGSTITALTLDMSSGGTATFNNELYIPNYIYHVSDANTYFGFPTNDEWKLVAGGTNKFAADVNAAYMYYQGNTKLATTNTGVSVTGALATTGINMTGILDISATYPRINLNDTNHEDDWSIINDDGHFKIYNVDDAVDAFKITATNDTTFAGTITTGSDLTIGGTGGIFIPENLYHVADTNTYIGFPATDEWRVVTGGAQRLDATNSGVRIGGGARVTTILDEDNMASDSATALATQQSIKAYVDSSITGSTTYRGTWDPDAGLNGGYGNPNLNTVTKQDGYYYICSANGSATPNGSGTEPDSWHTGDWVVYNSDLGSSGEWQKIDNTSVLSGTGTGQKVAKWDGSGTSETLANGPITFSNNDSTFAGNIVASSNTAVIQTPRISMEADGTLDWGLSRGHGTLTWDTGKIMMRALSGNAIELQTNGATTALTLDTSQNATFAGTITTTSTATGAITLNGGTGVATTGAFILRQNGDGAGNGMAITSSHATSHRIWKDASGNLNIGSSSDPDAFQQDISGNATFAGDVTVTGGDITIGTDSIAGNINSVGDVLALNVDSNTGGGAGANIQLKTAGTAQLTVTSSSATFAGNVVLAGNGTDNDSYAINFTNGACAIARDNNDLELHAYDNMVFGVSNTSYPSSAERMRINSSGDVGIGTSSPTYKLSVSGGIEAGGKVTYSDSVGSLTTTGYAVAGLTAGFNGASAGFEFKCYGGAGKYQRIVYSCYCDGTTWRPKKVIDEGTNDLDVSASADGTTITFTYKATSASQSYSPRILVEATGHSINSTYA